MSSKSCSIEIVYGEYEEVAYAEEIKISADMDILKTKASLLLDALLVMDILEQRWVDKEQITLQLFEFLRLHHTRLFPSFYIGFPGGLDSDGKYKPMVITDLEGVSDGKYIYMGWVQPHGYSKINFAKSAYCRTYGVIFEEE